MASTVAHGAQYLGQSLCVFDSITASGSSATEEPATGGGGGKESNVRALIPPASSLQGHHKEAAGRTSVRDPLQVLAMSPSPAFPALGVAAPYCDLTLWLSILGDSPFIEVS